VWAADGYTAPRNDKTGQALVAEDGSIAETQEKRGQAILTAHFPKSPLNNFRPTDGGRAFERVDSPLGRPLLAKAADTSAPGDYPISAALSRFSGSGTGRGSQCWYGHVSCWNMYR